MFDFMEMDFNGPNQQTETSGPYIPDAAECLRCGMCVSSCPTFRLFETDEETPRKRIRSIAKLLQNDAITEDERMHLDNCLQCRACESACPSRMAYGQLFDRAQALVAKRPHWLARLGFYLIEHKRRRNRLLPLLRLYLKSGLQKPLRQSGLLKKLGLAEAEALLGSPALQPLAETHASHFDRRGKVALFTGCIAEAFDRETLSATIELLNALGYDVVVPPGQVCCGAIHQHNGQSAKALINTNMTVFNALDVDAVIYTATGCGAMLNEYSNDDTEASESFRQRLYDINDFLLAHWPDQLELAPSDSRVAVHEPCSQRNVLKNQAAVYRLLEKVPGLSVTPLPDNPICCGAGGSYMLTHPDNATRLRESKCRAIRESRVDRIVSSNFGCAIFISTDSDKIVHPLVLLAGQLPSDTGDTAVDL
ncbi:MAG: (Fe-S)-binding protein [Methylomonas sp.]|nr:(Fe-S)-binding protein [Methylomonas sp.]